MFFDNLRCVSVALSIGFLCAGAAPALAGDVTRTVYHLSEPQQATPAMNNITFHLQADPTAKIVVVANYKAVQTFVFGAQDATGKPIADWIEELSAKGVEFRVCENSMRGFKISKDDLVAGVQTVKSGVAEIGRLESQEGYGYIKP